MKVLLVAEWVKIPGIEGGAIHHINYAKALASLGHEVHILCNCKDGFLGGNKKIFLHSAPKIKFRPKLSKASMPIIEKIIKKYDIDVVHKRLDPGSGYAIDIAHKLGIPVIAEINYNPFAFEKTGSFYTDYLRPLMQGYLRHNWAKKRYEQADAVCCVSYSVEETIKRHGIKPKSLSTIHNGVDIKKFNPSNKGIEIRSKYDKPIISLIGSLGPRHGLNQVIKASKLIPNALFLIIGGIEKYKQFIKQVKQVAPSNVKFTGGVDYEKIPDYIAASEICLAPYHESLNPKEPFGFCPIKILEYMAAGKPVIASNREWIIELIEDGKNGMIINLDNPKQLVDSINTLLEDKKLRKKLGSNARKRAEELSWENIAKEYVKVYKKLI